VMAEIFNNFDRQSEGRFMAALEARDTDSAERIKALMFTFDDLQRLTPQGLQLLLRTVEKEKLPVALKGASEDMRELFLRQLSERTGKMLRDDITQLGPVRMRDIEEAQSAIVNTAKELAADGQIEIGGSVDDELVY
jgi:flagellar motor switch protein FliG